MSAFASPPDPERAGSVDEIVQRLRLLKAWAGSPSFDTITARVNAAWSRSGRAADLVDRTTVVDCFRPGRRRLNADLVDAVVEALHTDPGYVARWRQALRVVGGEIQAAAQVRVSAALPAALPAFTARESELERVRSAFGDGTRVCLITGMAGAGKSQLAVRAGHLLAAEHTFDRVLFVNLRGFHEDATQPPADPSAVLDGMLQSLGVPSLRIPYGMTARATALRERLTGLRVLLVLDNAADEQQLEPLLPDTPGSFALVTSRRRLPGIVGATRLAVDAFTPAEALRFLGAVRPPVPLGPDPSAPARIARSCGYLPLALALMSGQLRATPWWTLTDHADRLDERRQERRLDDVVELTLRVSYDHLGGCRRLLRLLALHPGPDFDGYAAAALAGADPATVRAELDDLCRDHLVQPAGEGRYAFHDLVRAFAANR
ncbi:NB-ARC domain-containing protein, partial [Actinoplanes sp. NPDC048791]|uniref:NB-ARC domain-containing protein n=1 Tax=Actinoplanes sp. NPDC048791 TaxID=3154623 RepID=UPI0033D84AA7